MERYRALVTCLLILLSCTEAPDRMKVNMLVKLSFIPGTRSSDPGSVQISDYNILVYNSFGILEKSVYVPEREFSGLASAQLTLLEGTRCTVLAAANLGYELPALSLEQALEYRYHMAYPDEYSHGIPMAAVWEGKAVDGCIEIPLERLMARVDISLDTRALDDDVSLDVREICVENCPSAVSPFSENRAREFFTDGFSKSGRELDALANGSSVSVYLLENIGGEKPSYIELKSSYHSDSYHTKPGEYLIYRFLIGDGTVERNAVYRVNIKPEGSGLNRDGWDTDKGGIQTHIAMDLHPAAYNQCSVADSFHLWCSVLPRGTPMEIEALAYDQDERVADIFDYSIDSDGCGITVHPRKSGSAVVYFKAGPPVNRDTLAMLVILP